MRKAIGSILFGAGLIAVSPACAAPQDGNCGPADKINEFLTTQFQEEISGAGIKSGGGYIEVYVSANGATFTVVEISADNATACIRYDGAGWAQIPFVPPRKPEMPKLPS